MFWKVTFAIEENNPLFVIFLSVTFGHRNLEPADSPMKFYLLFLPPGNTITEKTKEYFLEYSEATLRSELVSSN